MEKDYRKICKLYLMTLPRKEQGSQEASALASSIYEMLYHTKTDSRHNTYELSHRDEFDETIPEAQRQEKRALILRIERILFDLKIRLQVERQCTQMPTTIDTILL